MCKTKQVVIKGSNNSEVLLTPYWIIEYYKRKGQQIYCYIEDLDYNIKLYTQEELKDIKNSLEYDCEYFSTKLITNNIYEELGKLNENELFGTYDFERKVNREDSVLIQIAKEINNPKQIKIVEILTNVEYDIYENDQFGGEYIAEKHRTWY